MAIIKVLDSGFGVEPSLFDPEHNGADVAAFAEMWPNAIYFEVEFDA